jgi:hypothetical protein
VRDRADTAAAIPVLGEALDLGDVGGEHVDAVTKALKAAPSEVREQLRESAAGMVKDITASGLTPDDVGRRLADETKRLEADDGVARLERHRRATRLKTWTDKHSGMFRVSGWFDPLTGVAVQGRLHAAMAAMFAHGIPEMAPDDPGERQDFLRALAMVALTAGVRARTSESGTDSTVSGSSSDSTPTDDLAWVPFGTSGPPRFGRPEMIVVLDFTNRDVEGRPTVDWGSPISLPFACVEDLSRNALITKVVVNNGNVVDPDGELDLGRTSRLANAQQRRALRALYSTCAVPGCNVRFDFTKPHHVRWWRNGGSTDLCNLLPLCAVHHSYAHHGWIFSLGPNRQLTIRLPSGQVMSTGPPNRAAA